MINRYQVPEVAQIWSDESKFQLFLQVECALLKLLEARGIAPAGTTAQIEKAEIRPERIAELEVILRHDVISFCTSITEQVPAAVGKYFHYGLTSSDVIDTVFSIQIKQSLTLVVQDLTSLLAALLEKANQYQQVLCLGRSHGMYAEPLIFGQKFLISYFELARRLERYQQLTQQLPCQASGAVGSYSILPPEIETDFGQALQLPVEAASTQVISRDHYAQVIQEGALLASGLEKLAVHLRLLHQSDVSEVSEGFKPGQKGSSAMPHKKNPIAGENISGLARIIKSHSEVALQNNVLWYERDISHSSAERLMMPDHFILLCYILRRCRVMIADLVINTDHIEEKVNLHPQWYSGHFLHQLLPHVPVSREELYAFIQQQSFQLSPQHCYQDYHEQLMRHLPSCSWYRPELNQLIPPMRSLLQWKEFYRQRFMPKLRQAQQHFSHTKAVS